MKRIHQALGVIIAMAINAAEAAERPPMVLGYQQLLHAPGGAHAEAGEVLLAELSCLACHSDDSKLPAALAWKPGPNLSAVGDRLRADYIRRYLASPAAAKPGTTMPNLLAG